MRIRNRGAAGALVALCILGCIAGWRSYSSAPAPRANDHSHHESKPAQEEKCAQDGRPCLGGIVGFVDRNRDDINAVSTLAIACLTIALVIVGYTQATRLRQTIDQMRVAEERELRAYVGVRLPEGAPPSFDIKDGPYCAIEIVNYGKTPAYKMTNWINSAIATPNTNINDSRFVPSPDDIDPYPTTLQSGATNKIVTTGPKPKPGVSDAFINNQLSVFIYGEIKYLDVFRKERITKFRLIFDVNDLRGGTSGVRFCKEGNEAT